MLKIWRSQNGYTGIDVAVSIIILLVFTAIISTIFVNIYMQYSDAQRNSVASSYLVSLAETVDKMYYQDVSTENLQDAISNMNIAKGYTVTANVTRYQTGDSEDLVKTVSINVSYKLGNNTKNLSIDKIKAKEILITPNRPKISSNMVPVKYVVTDIITGTGYWQITSENDSTWYSYDNKVWANMMLADNLVVEGNIIVTNDNKANLAGKRITTVSQNFVWIPRYWASGEELKFLYSTSDKYVNQEGNLANLGNNYTISEAFNENTGFWIARLDYDIIKTQLDRNTTLMSVTAAQKQAAMILSQSKYGENFNEFTISDNRYAMTISQ